jgi:hypothetical protein
VTTILLIALSPIVVSYAIRWTLDFYSIAKSYIEIRGTK